MGHVSLKKVEKIYPNGVKAVKGIDLEVRDREFMVLVGPSGCGKSTTLRMVAGLETISHGTVQIGDRVVNNVPPKERDIAMVFQNYALYPHMTVRANMSYGLKMRRYKKDDIIRRVNNAAEILGITELLDRRPKALSGGQRQRVAVGRAIVRKPQVFLFDEPLSNLDAKMRVSMRAEISKLHKRLESTIMYVTHDQVEAMTMGSRICVMNEGEIQQVDTPMAIYSKPANRFVAGFIGSPPMNFFEGQLTTENGATVFSAAGLKLTVAPEHAESLQSHVGSDVTLGMRASDIQLSADGINADIELVEPMGDETCLYCMLADQPLTIKISGTQTVPEKHLTCAFQMERAHFFDALTNQRIN